jgi:hypothetical protein
VATFFGNASKYRRIRMRRNSTRIIAERYWKRDRRAHCGTLNAPSVEPGAFLIS